MTATTYPLSELRAALRELDAGTFTHPSTFHGVAAGLDLSAPAAVGVVGVSGGVGATIVALAIAEAIGADRLIELCPSWLSGLVEATTAELGHDQGWRLGKRGNLLIERRDSDTAAVRDVPGRVVIDGGTWDGTTLQFAEHAGALVVVAPCTVPGLRRLSNLLSLSATGGHIFAVLTGASPRKPLTRGMASAGGPEVEALILNGRLVIVPACSSLRRAGITGNPLPKALLGAATTVAHQLKDVLP
ncbi:hypothetical protein [Tessaracoccus antarcticus]|uniref:Uncharacterized protein n=1 Tax=Tessaracoccus antarcticus TaxID=2479848 RepID=A0A3M0FXK0_9ACTN|nr:hypothetical protein [Tessaracoccus antarcticus]RMB57235.1 hypothetical protein EAX62_15955 [Tessaracoccus antarcticus]